MMTLFSDKKGWILIDIILGMIILTIALLSLSVTFTQSVRGTVTMKNRTTAAYLAKQQLEILRQYDGSPNKSDSIVWTTVDPALVGNNNGYEYNLKVLTDTSLKENIIPVQIKVSWFEANINKNFTTVAYYYRK